MQRAATAVWNGTLKEGKGTISTRAAFFPSTPYSFVTRFENGKGTNPEELIAAAHAGCFTMALSAQLGTMNFTPESLRTKATVTLEKLEAGWTISQHSSRRRRESSRHFGRRPLNRQPQARKRTARCRDC